MFEHVNEYGADLKHITRALILAYKAQQVAAPDSLRRIVSKLFERTARDYSQSYSRATAEPVSSL